MRYVKIAIVVLTLMGCKRGPEKIETPEGEGAEALQDVRCGQNVCHGGQVCCNPSCGICAPPDGMCTQQFCDTPQTAEGTQESLPAAPTTCDHVRCAGGTHCELVEVQCIKAPCPPVPECKQDEARSNEQR
ncbi:MAG TPA: hypothetical protein VFX59_19660 [Polyangiales bacterium]|nr:hypothetical protein [Polyangiales bacterium]